MTGRDGGPLVKAAPVLLDLLFPRICFVCGRPLKPGKLWHNDCLRKIPLISGQRCPRCGVPLAKGRSGCPECDGKERAFRAAYGVFPYEGPLREALLALKFRGRREFAAPLGRLLAAAGSPAAAAWRTDTVTFVPAHPQRIRARGYDQAGLLAKEFAFGAGLEKPAALLARKKDTRAMKGLGKEERSRNLAGAFAYAGTGAEGRRILLIDDIYTTGATAEECARVLLEAGAECVYVLALCTARPAAERF